MLEFLIAEHGPIEAVRLVAPESSHVNMLSEMGVDPEDFEENLAYYRDLDATPESHLEWIFVKRVQQGRPQGRFTDGSIPVFYTATERSTAEAETAHWLVPLDSAPHYFRTLSVSFYGKHVDLHQVVPRPQCLTGEQTTGAYAACLKITQEATSIALDGFKTPSARRQGGVCFPILRREAIGEISASGYLRLDFNADQSRWTCRPV